MSLKKWLGKKVFHLCLLMLKNDGIFTKKPKKLTKDPWRRQKKDHDLKKLISKLFHT